MKSVKSAPRQLMALALGRVKLYVTRRPALRAIVVAFLEKFPALSGYIQQYLKRPNSIEYADLSPRARRIYADFKAAMSVPDKDKRQCGS